MTFCETRHSNVWEVRNSKQVLTFICIRMGGWKQQAADSHTLTQETRENGGEMTRCSDGEVCVCVDVDSSTNDELIALGHERFDDTNLGGHLGTTNDGSEGALRAGERVREGASDWKESKAGRA
jgi:hypothetical protein